MSSQAPTASTDPTGTIVNVNAVTMVATGDSQCGTASTTLTLYNGPASSSSSLSRVTQTVTLPSGSNSSSSSSSSSNNGGKDNGHKLSHATMMLPPTPPSLVTNTTLSLYNAATTNFDDDDDDAFGMNSLAQALSAHTRGVSGALDEQRAAIHGVLSALREESETLRRLIARAAIDAAAASINSGSGGGTLTVTTLALQQQHQQRQRRHRRHRSEGVDDAQEAADAAARTTAAAAAAAADTRAAHAAARRAALFRHLEAEMVARSLYDRHMARREGEVLSTLQVSVHTSITEVDVS